MTIMMLECHITVSPDDALEAIIVAKNMHWKTSEMVGDPVLGDKKFFYLTTHDTDWQSMFDRMSACTRELDIKGVRILREKIELIVHDTKGKT